MFTVKQETDSGDMIWTDIEVISTAKSGEHGQVDVVYARPKSGEIRFDSGPGKHTIYVMNAAGATVARYELGYRIQTVRPLAAETESPAPEPIAA